MRIAAISLLRALSRSPHGERGLKYYPSNGSAGTVRRSPHGERGLKCQHVFKRRINNAVALLMESVD